MKSKVLAVLKPLLANRGFNKEELEGLAEIAVKNLNEASTDEDINNVVNGVIPYADLMQKVSNRMVTSVEHKYKGWINPNDVPKPDPTPEPPKKDEPKGLSMEDIQKMIADGISEGLKPYKEREEKQRLQTLLYSHEKVKAVPEEFRNLYSLNKEEELETVASRMEADYTAIKQALIKSGEFVAPPQQGSGASETDDLVNMLHAMGEKGNK